MGQRPRDDGFEPGIAKLLRNKAYAMRLTNDLTYEDERDLRQELAVHLVQEMPRHDPSRASRRAFAGRIISSRAITIMQGAYAKKRSRKRHRNFSDGAGSRVHDMRPRAVDTSIDVQAAFESLSPDLKSIGTLFEKHNEAEVIRISGLTRQRVRTAKAQIAAHFRTCGLDPKTNSDAPNQPAPHPRT